ncbi:hypothetical protein [Afifella sp. IM 167]|uniref:hypothetical protein n=1 Tax=Afifella sp. IM 167 TaxID=2033586 RepID=UPI001CCFF83F|nr:hypothetical protein [Afifella sp. IM 167]
MAGSEAERELRDAVVAHLHDAMPKARVVHELVCGGCRADLAAVERDRLTLFEIKSERDTLVRLAEQVRQFTRAAHAVVVVAHEKHFDRTPYKNGQPRFAAPDELHSPGGHRYDELWCAPPDADDGTGFRGLYRWHLPRWSQKQPQAYYLLDLLWRDELIAEASAHQVPFGKRPTRHVLITQMVWEMTGREIAQAVCRQLRRRAFPEADAAIVEDAARPVGPARGVELFSQGARP